MFASIVAAAAVATASPSPTPSVGPEIAHVVTSDRSLESAARTARTTYVVTAAQIARDGDRTVADALERVPGVNIVRYGAFGAAATVGIRGSSSQQVLVLVDGLPMAGSQINDVNLEQFAASGIDRIEVVEGGGSTLYGSGSIGGVINIITAPQAARSTATFAAGSFDEQTYLLQTPFVTFQRTYATNDYSVLNGPNRQNSQAGLTRRKRALRARDRGVRIHAVGRHRRRNLGRAGFARLLLADQRTSQRQSRPSAQRRTQGNARHDVARARRVVAEPVVHVQYAG